MSGVESDLQIFRKEHRNLAIWNLNIENYYAKNFVYESIIENYS